MERSGVRLTCPKDPGKQDTPFGIDKPNGVKRSIRFGQVTMSNVLDHAPMSLGTSAYEAQI